MNSRELRPRVVSDPVLGPLLERLAALESANYRLKNNLSERSFNVEARNAALNEQLARAKEEISRHQEMLENVCAEILVAAQARDRAQAEAEESLRARSEAVSQLDGLRRELDEAQKASAVAEARVAQSRRALEESVRSAQVEAEASFNVREALAAHRDVLRQQLEGALKAGADAAERSEQSRRALEEVIRTAQSAAEESSKIRAEAASQREEALKASAVQAELVSQRDSLRLQLDEARKASAEAEAEDGEARRKLEEYVRAAQAAAEESFKVRAEIATQRDVLLFRLDEAAQASSLAEARVRAMRANAETSSKVRAELVLQRDSLRLLLDDALKVSADTKARGALLENDIRVMRAEAETNLKFRAELTLQRDALRLRLDEALKAGGLGAGGEAGAGYPTMEYALEPGWARLLHLLKSPLQAAYGHLRRLSSGKMSAGQRAILRLTGSSLSQAADSLATIELALADSPAMTETAPLLPALESALEAWDAVFRRRGIALTREFSRVVPDAPHDPEQLRLALHHMLRNAVEALPRRASLRVRLGKNAAGAVEIEFHDDGPGYPAAWLERQFEPFASPRQGHAGLGLAAVRRALRRWGGDAAVSPGHGNGARLTLTFAPDTARPAAKA